MSYGAISMYSWKHENSYERVFSINPLVTLQKVLNNYYFFFSRKRKNKTFKTFGANLKEHLNNNNLIFFHF